jgi:hypothetical protein
MTVTIIVTRCIAGRFDNLAHPASIFSIGNHFPAIVTLPVVVIVTVRIWSIIMADRPVMVVVTRPVFLVVGNRNPVAVSMIADTGWVFHTVTDGIANNSAYCGADQG